MEPIRLKDLKRGEWFIRKPNEYPKEKQVFIRGDYIRGTHKYECQRFSDISDAIYLKDETIVYVDFVF